MSNDFGNDKLKPETLIEIEKLIEKSSQIIKSKPEKALELADEVLKLMKSDNNKELKAKIFDIIGKSYIELGNYKEALIYTLEAYELNKYLKKKNEICISLNDLGIIYGSLYQYDKSMHALLHALELGEDSLNQIKRAHLYANIGTVYEKTRNYTKSLEHYEKAYSIYLKENANQYLGKILNDIGSIYHKLGNIRKALEFNKKSIKIYKEIENQKEVSASLLSIGKLYYDLKDYELAEEYYNEALKLSKKSEEEELICSIYNELGKAEIRKKEIYKAEEYLLKAYEIAENKDFHSCRKNICGNLVLLYEEKEDFQKALYYQKKLTLIEKNFYSETSIRKINELHIRYEIDKKEKEAEIYRLKNIELAETNEKLRAANSAKDKFLSILSHDIKNQFTVLVALSEMLYKFFDDHERERQLLYIRELNELSKELTNIFTNILEWGRSQTGKIKFKPDFYNLYEILDSILLPLEKTAERKKISIANEIPQTALMYCDKNMMETILRNLITNGIKFTERNGSVNIYYRLKGDEHEIIVEDTGVGIDEKFINDLFNADKITSTEGTEEEKGFGLGLVLCREFAEYHNGNITAENCGNGSRFIFTAPVNSGF